MIEKRRRRKKIRKLKMIDTIKATKQVERSIIKQLNGIRNRGVNPNKDEFAVVQYFGKNQYIAYIWENLRDKGHHCTINIGDGTSPEPKHEEFTYFKLPKRTSEVLDILP